MAKKEKVVDLKPELDKITDEQLKGLQEIVNAMNGMEMGRMATQKHMLLHQVTDLQKSLQEEQAKLEAEYGKVNINIQTGAIEYPEDVKADS